MKIFIGQTVGGEDREKLKKEYELVEEVLRNKGHEPVCIIDYPPKIALKDRRERLKYAFTKIDECESYLAIIRREEKSEGLLMELGHILGSDKKIILAINSKVDNTYLREIADKVIEFSEGSLIYKLRETDF